MPIKLQYALRVSHEPNDLVSTIYSSTLAQGYIAKQLTPLWSSKNILQSHIDDISDSLFMQVNLIQMMLHVSQDHWLNKF